MSKSCQGSFRWPLRPAPFCLWIVPSIEEHPGFKDGPRSEAIFFLDSLDPTLVYLAAEGEFIVAER
jgi:hypothetical protein